ncbi:MAG: hypothetical protein R2865_13175 [Deinococcales bacterium]
MFKLLTGPAGSGKTSYLLNESLKQLALGKRLWWIGLPSQRDSIYQRASAKGPLLGLEFLSQQQLYYRLLAREKKLKRLLKGTGRIALVGQALLNLHKELPSPGEARLLAMPSPRRNVFLSTPNRSLCKTKRVNALRAIFQEYERLKAAQEEWDYDDFRTETYKLALAGSFQPEIDLIIVDGFRETGPLRARHLSSPCQEG